MLFVGGIVGPVVLPVGVAVGVAGGVYIVAYNILGMDIRICI